MAVVEGLDAAVSGNDEVVGVLRGGAAGALHPVGCGDDVVGEGRSRGLPVIDDDEELEGLEGLVDALGVRRPGQRVGGPADAGGDGVGVLLQNCLPHQGRAAQHLVQHRAVQAEHLAVALVDRLEAMPGHDAEPLVADVVLLNLGGEEI